MNVFSPFPGVTIVLSDKAILGIGIWGTLLMMALAVIAFTLFLISWIRDEKAYLEEQRHDQERLEDHPAGTANHNGYYPNHCMQKNAGI